MAFLGVQKYPSRLGNSPKYSPGDIFNRIVEENERKRQEEELEKQRAEYAAFNEEAKRRAQLGLPANSNPKHEEELALRDRRLSEIASKSRMAVRNGQSNPIQRDISGWPVNPNRVTSLRPGAGINPTQSTYGFSSMQPSNRAGEVYTIDQWGNKRYL
jgi:hypothetical protein